MRRPRATGYIRRNAAFFVPGGAPLSGWTGYAPLSGLGEVTGPGEGWGQTMWIFSIALFCLGALLWSFLSPSGQISESPIIGDRDYKVAKAYNMLPAEVEGDPHDRTPASDSRARRAWHRGSTTRTPRMSIRSASSPTASCGSRWS